MHKIKIDRHMVRRVKTASGGCARNSPQLLLQQMARSADCHSNASVCYFILLHCNFFFLLCFTYFSFQERHVTVSVWKSEHKKPFLSPRGSEGSQVGRLGSKHRYLLSPLAGPLPYLLIELGANQVARPVSS